MAREIIADLYEFMLQLDARIKVFDCHIDLVFRSNADCQRIAKICGVGSKTATAVVATIGDGKKFKNGRHMAAWMGLVLQQHSSGDKRLLMGISIRGDKHLRTLSVHGAWSVIRVYQGITSAFSKWVNSIRERRGMNRAIVAVANKNTRIIWAMLHRNEPTGTLRCVRNLTFITDHLLRLTTRNSHMGAPSKRGHRIDVCNQGETVSNADLLGPLLTCNIPEHSLIREFSLPSIQIIKIS